MKRHQEGNGNAPDHWSCGIYGHSVYRCASSRPGLSLLSARPAMGLPGQLWIHELPAMRSHGFRDRFVLWLKPAFCLWTAAASASSVKARFIARPHRNGFDVRGMARGAARGAFKRRPVFASPNMQTRTGGRTGRRRGVSSPARFYLCRQTLRPTGSTPRRGSAS